MKPLNILIIFGGCSGEYRVSLESVCGVLESLDREKYNPVTVGITRCGDWYYYSGSIKGIRNDCWFSSEYTMPALISVDKTKRELIVFGDGKTEVIQIDAAFPVLHGKNGEDGTVQGLIELSGIPLIGCNTLSSALCMDKDKAHRLVSAYGIHVPLSAVLSRTAKEGEIAEAADGIGYPLYVKPVRAGSSLGITRVSSKEQLSEAVKNALLYDSEIILEENIEGVETGCAVIGSGADLTVGEPDEIMLENGFFDYLEKYTPKTSQVICPSSFSDATKEKVKCTARAIYNILGCSGFARVDMFLTKTGKIYFNEVNTIPGFTSHSRFPAMLKATGYTDTQITDKVIQEALNKESEN